MTLTKILLPILALLVQIQVLKAQDTLNQKLEGAYITFEERMKEIGDIVQGDSLKYTFKFTNTGDKDLILKNVITTCTCTLTKYSKEALAPGKSSQIEVTFDSNKQDKIGRQNKVITILSNAQNNPERVILNFNILEKEKR